MRLSIKSAAPLALLGALLTTGSPCLAQGGRPTNTISVAAMPGLVNFALLPAGPANGDSPITITTTWDLNPSVTSVTLYAYFIDSAAALSSGLGDRIPSGNVYGKVGTGAFTSFTGSGPFGAGGSLTIFSENILGRNRRKTRTDALELRIDTAGLALPAGTYTGTLRLQVQVI